MKILLKSACIIDPESPFHNQTVSILIDNGVISSIGANLSSDSKTKVVSLENLHVSQGWFDSSVCFGEPGYEERETLSNGLLTSAKSGFTSVAINPNTNPVIDNASVISFLKSKANQTATDLLVVGNLTSEAKGKDLAELYDMKSHGACSFGDYKKPITNPNLLKIALQYAQSFDGLIQSFPQENAIAGKGIVNEHVSSTQLGLKGIPVIAESLQIARDLHILEYTGGKLHIPTISSEQSVALIRNAKNKGLDISCSVAIHNLIFDDSMLNEFGTNYKVLPPLRTKTDCTALISGILDGAIDMVTSDHCPIDIENKQVEFDNALYGSIGLESAFGALLTVLPLEVAITKLQAGKNRFGITRNVIKEGEIANLSLFNPKETYTFSKKHIYSTNTNAAFLGSELKGKSYGIIANNQIILP